MEKYEIDNEYTTKINSLTMEVGAEKANYRKYKAILMSMYDQEKQDRTKFVEVLDAHQEFRINIRNDKHVIQNARRNAAANNGTPQAHGKNMSSMDVRRNTGKSVPR